MKCQCNYQFALDPKADRMTDGKLLSLVLNASGNGTNYFTRRQLYTAYCRKKKSSEGCSLVGFWTLWTVFASLPFLFFPNFLQSPVALGFGLFFVIGVIGGVAAIFLLSVAPSQSVLENALSKYQGVKGPIDKLIDSPSLFQPILESPELSMSRPNPSVEL